MKYYATLAAERVKANTSLLSTHGRKITNVSKDLQSNLENYVDLET
jgi:hypothetical protein